MEELIWTLIVIIEALIITYLILSSKLELYFLKKDIKTKLAEPRF